VAQVGVAVQDFAHDFLKIVWETRLFSGSKSVGIIIPHR